MVSKGSFNPVVAGITGVLIFATVLAVNPFVVINSGEVGITKTMGSVSSTVKEAGLNFKIPFAQEVIPVSVKNKQEGGEVSAFSSDLQTMMVHYKTIYAIPANKAVDMYVKYNGDPYTNFVQPRIEESIKTVSARYTAESLAKKREEAKNQIVELVNKKLKGIVEINDIALINIDLSADLKAAIEAKQVEQQKAEQKKYELIGAKQDAQITITKAKAEAEAITKKTLALKKSPQYVQLELTKVQMKLAEKWDGTSVPNTVVTGQGGSNILLPIGGNK